MENKTNDVIALGNALMDFLIEVDDNYLTNLNLTKGQFHSFEEDEAKQLLGKIQDLNPENVPGGSAANTLRAISFLGGKTIFSGKVGNDLHGENYINEMNKIGVQTKIIKNQELTGHAITFVTPDKERTFAVYLGAATKVREDNIDEEDIKNSKILHVEGYHLGSSVQPTILKAINLAKQYNTLVSLDVSDPGVINNNQEVFQRILPKIDILFANEEEAKALLGLKPEQAVQQLAQIVKIAIVKIGKEGSLICRDGIITYINGHQANAIDTTGAGDTYAAGFLYGYCQGWDLEKAGNLGSKLASQIVEQKGVKINNLKKDSLELL